MIGRTNFSSSNKTTSAESLAYWQNQLNTAPPYLDMPGDFPRDSHDDQTDRSFGKINLLISEELNSQLASIAQKNIDLELIFLSAYYVLLYRYTNQHNFAIGYFRDRQNQVSDLIPLVFADINTESSFPDLVDRVGELRATAIQESKIQTRTEQNIWWDRILFSYNDKSSQYLPPLNDRQSDRQELYLKIDRQSSQISLEFARNLFLPDTCQRMIRNYYRLLNDVVEHYEADKGEENPSQRQLDKLTLLTEAEAKLVLERWNQTEVELETRCVHQLFKIRAKQTPQAIALKCQERQLTYGELNQKSNQLAHYLQNLGVGKNSLVGLYLERSLDMVVGVLGILKAGAGYVPLDRENPPSRLAYILEDSQIKVLLTESALEAELPESANLQSSIYLDRDWHQIERESSDNLNIDLDPSDVAHIVYTSGSTGKPKGVIITHGNLSHYAHSLQIALEITPKDVYLHRGSIALIVSARQLLMPLAQGATVSILTTADKKDPLKMFELIKQHGVTIVDRVPSFWRNFSGILDSLSVERRQSLMDNRVRLVAAGGERVSVEIYQCWRQLFKPEVELANIYGQTEGTGVVTVYYIPEQIDLRCKSLPVGSPIPNMRVYVLDKQLQPVPIGVTGEIHISGAGVAAGYLNKPELTAQKFIPNPYVPGAKLYKTGDLGRFLPNGTIQFQGRSDRQVNINGLRLELGEIETTLVQHPQILESAVVVQNNKLNQTLTAYIVPSQNPPTRQEIRDFVLDKLPKYMLPNKIVFCDSFPLTASGKIDRNALSAGESDNQKSDYIAPNSPIESEIVRILENILGISQVGIEDDFIELGGNSLIAARLVAEIEQKYALKIPISRVFQSSTPKALAQLISQKETTAGIESFVPIKQGKSRPILFGIHNLGYGLCLYLPLAKHLDPNISLYGLSSFFSNETNLPHPRDILALAAYYAEKIQLVQPQPPYYLMGVSFGGLLAYETAQVLVSQGHEVAFVGLIDTFLPDRKSAAKLLPLKDRLVGHIKKLTRKGTAHIVDRIQWRTQNMLNNARANLYDINWVRENLVDPTSRNYAMAQYAKRRKEYQKVNRNYQIKPYPGHVTLFRAAEDMDLKLGWRELAQSGLSIYDVPGEHMEVIKEPNVRVLAQKLNSAIVD